jgi:hypothetical protein
MPYVIRWPHKRVIALAATSLSLLVAASPAAAYGGSWSSPYSQYQPAAPSSSCAIPQSSSVFSALGDTASYALLPGGDFAGSPLSGWALNGASVVPGGEPWNVSGNSNQSLNIPSGGYAVTPSFCLTSQLPSWRFFAQAADGSWGTQLKVTALWSDIYGNSGQLTAATLYGGGFTSWQATSSLPLGSVLAPGDVVNVRFVFSANSYGGAWNIDDVYVDPYAR